MGTRHGLTALQDELLHFITDAAEPTWLMLRDVPEAGSNRERIEAALADLETRGLIGRTRELSFNPESTAMEDDDWWALTERGWQLLGLSRPPNYH